MKTALIIDDNAEFRNTLSRILEEGGWRVMQAGGGESGIELVRRNRPEIVLCDLLMPQGNGFQVCRAIRAEVALRQTRIIIISGRDYEADRLAAMEAGADLYLTKPISAELVIKAMEELRESTGKKVVAPVRGPSSPATVRFWGVRGSTPSPGPGTVRYGGNTSCVEVRAGNEIIILDAGTGMRALGKSLLAEFKDKPLNASLLLTHTHWDHIQGLPFFGPIYNSQARLRIFGFEGARKSLVHILSGQMESPYFPVPFQELPGNVEIEELKELTFLIGSVRVEAWFVNHPGICVGYRIFTDDGSVVYIPDNEPLYRHRIETAVWPKGGRDSIEFAQEEERRLISFLQDADVLIMDSQYDSEEYQQHVGWGHGCVDDAVAIATRANIKKLFLFHHDPDHDDAKIDSMVAHGQKVAVDAKGGLKVEGAIEGTVVELAAISRTGRRSRS